MARILVPSTPQTRGEKPVKVEEPPVLEPPTPEVPGSLQPDTVPPMAEPAGNASRDEWAAYARSRGAVDEDLVDEDGKDLGRDALREKYQSPPSGDAE